MTRRADHLRPATEAEVEASVVDRFALAGWYPVKTEANMLRRGKAGQTRPGHIPPGFPDYLFMLGLGEGTGLGLCVLVELKRPKGGKLSARQRLMRANLGQNYGLAVHVVRSMEEAEAVIALGDRLQAALLSASEGRL
ncbi:hypothetical protein [Deinococcus radiophilus]|uniref:VRR-NUC domain-containing protein n=1 Tax=Deinococcus radiophilus TaxID=32062 RepID=A0A431W0R4_9DEIO|nr:hypothetical protein [Deinococcus radiophilus]RTR29048.1 hypothetical protein EJ104_04175 [Deinococcus radiophilus]UFA49634.1 hypothetical protein LMT64_06930 [Deinococcus radiophilus]